MKGIENPGAKCYFNSGLQMLYHLGPCHDYITKYTGDIPDLKHVKTAFALLDSSGGGPVTLSAETTAGLTVVGSGHQVVGSGHQVVGSGHQDVTDFLNKRFFNHVKQADISSLFFVDEEEVKCRDNSGNYIDPKKIPYPHPILILPMKDIYGQTLTGLTDEYQKEELITGPENLHRCSDKGFFTTVKKHTITIPEQNRYLIVSLKRFVASLSAGTFKQNKLENPVIADDLLTIGGVKFTLRGIIYHTGGVTGGHYVYHLKTEPGWTEFNDSSVTPPLTISDKIKNSGYVYLYERVLDPAAVPAQASAAVPAVPAQAPAAVPAQASAAVPAVPAQASAAVPANLTNFLTRQSISVNANWSILEPVQTIPDEIKPYIGETKSFVRAPAEFKGEYEFLKVHGLAFLVGTDMFIHEAAKQLYGDGGAFATQSAAKYLRLMYTYTLPGRKRALEYAKGLATNTEARFSVDKQLSEMQSYLNRIEVVMDQASTRASTQAHTPPTQVSTQAPAGPGQASTQAHTPPAQTPTLASTRASTQAHTTPASDPSGQQACLNCTFNPDADKTQCPLCRASFVKPPAVIVMRHGVRADFPQGLCEVEDISNAWIMLDNILQTKNTKTERSYDSPLCEYTHPKEAYNDISGRFAQITRIVTSPFVRCVQTAAAIAAQMPTVPEIFVNRNLGEKYSTLRTYTYNNTPFQELTVKQLNNVFNQAYKAAGSEDFSGNFMLREKSEWDISGTDQEWITMLDTEIKEEISQKVVGTLLLITHGDVARIINNHRKYFITTGIPGVWTPDYCGYYTNISDPKKLDEFSTEWKAGKFIVGKDKVSAAVGTPINKEIDPT